MSLTKTNIQKYLKNKDTSYKINDPRFFISVMCGTKNEIDKIADRRK